MMRKIGLILIICCSALHHYAQVVVDAKGTKLLVDSSKWKLSGTNLYNKNTGNVGIGTPSPQYKLDVTSPANPLRLTGVQNGAIATDSIVSIFSGIIRKIAVSDFNKNDSTTASNGISLTGKDVRLGGNLTQATTITSNSNALTIATGGSSFNITGLTAGAVTDSLLTVNTSTGRINRIAVGALNKNDSTTASNGLALTGKDVRLGGNLTQATTITSNTRVLTFATGGTALNITGLTAGAITDSLLTINTTTGRVNRIAVGALNKNDSTTASNGIALTGKDVRLGGNLTQSTTITNNTNALTFATGGSALNITGLTSGSLTDSLVTVNASTGKISQISITQLNKNDSTTASNGIALTGKDVRLGGNLTQSTTIINNANALTFATGGSALNITGLSAGAITDSLLTVNTTTGRVNRIAVGALNKNDSTTASNGLALAGKDVRLGGSLTAATTITTSTTNTLSIGGLQSGSLTTDSLLVITPANVVKRVSPNVPQLLVNATRTTNYTPAATFAKLAYNNAIVNSGTAYNTATGDFTVPATGLYQITVINNYRSNNANDNGITLRLITGTTTETEAGAAMSPYSASNNIQQNASINSIVSLTAGTVVNIQVGGLIGTMTPQTGAGQHVLKIVRLF